ncbi:FtsK/SpoIIIE domain-containing protein [soil metagenome]
MRVRLTLQAIPGNAAATGADAAVLGTARDVEIDCAAGTTLGAVAPALCELLGQPAGAVISSDGRLLAAPCLLGGPHLRSGTTLDFGQVRPDRGPAPSMLQLRVVGGPDAGQSIPLQLGRHVIGRDKSSSVQIADPDLSRRHLEITVNHSGLRLRDLNSTNGTSIEGTPVGAEQRALELNALILAGNSALTVIGAGEPPAASHPTDDGTVLVNRPPRIGAEAASPSVEFPEGPRRQSMGAAHLAGAILPAGLAVALAAAMHNLQFLAFALLTPASLLATGATQRVASGRSHRRGKAGYRRQLAAAQTCLQSYLVAEAAMRREAAPDPASILQSATTPDCHLWERRRGDADFLTVRIGLANLPARTTSTRAGKLLPSSEVRAVPATVPLTNGALGMSGPPDLVQGLARTILAQLITLHSPNDLVVYALLGEQSEHWHALKWLQGSQGPVVRIARDPDVNRKLLAYLADQVEARRSQFAAASPDWTGRWTVLLIDPAHHLAGLPGLHTVLQHGPSVGITALCIEAERRMLPPECRTIAAVAGEAGTEIDLVSSTSPSASGIVADRVSTKWAEDLCRALAPLRDADHDSVAALDGELRLIELLALPALSASAVVQHWSMGIGPRTPVGRSTAGTVEIDLRRDGPHVLIAGSTGSGKSELLRTLVAGLAVANAPTALSFVLIDYKGGAAFAECAELPHCLGLVTDLDSHLTRRALTSLEAELRRREAVLGAAGVADIQQYVDRTQGLDDPLPRLVLVVDEFAAMAEELPDFVSGLVGIAQRGRSLGVHLVLATQHPSGVVSPEIKANMALRIALRVTDPGDSTDVIGTEAAAAISKSTPGRAYARTADGLVQVQTARTGLAVQASSTPTVTTLDRWHERCPSSAGEVTSDDMALLRDVTWGAVHALGRAVPKQPWLEPLPPLHLAPGTSLDACDAPDLVRFGIADDPDNQRRQILQHDLSAGGSIGLIGGPRSGRTSFVRTFLGLASQQLSPEDLHCYVLDCANGSLRPLDQLPHCGSLLTRNEPAAVATLIQRLAQELDRRHQLCAELGVSTAAEARATGRHLPWIVLAIDGWEGLTAASEEHDSLRSVETTLRLLRESGPAGFTILVTGDRSLLSVRVAPTLQRKFLLEPSDRTDAGLVGLRDTDLPISFVPGRGVSVSDALEVQLSLLDADFSVAGQWSAIRRVAAVTAAPKRSRPIAVRALPRSVTAEDLATTERPSPHAARVGHLDRTTSDRRVLLGAGGDDAGPVVLQLLALHSRFLVVGPARSGRSATAVTLGRQVLRHGGRLLNICPGRSPLAAWALASGLPVLDSIASAHERGSQSVVERFEGDLVIIDDADELVDSHLADGVTALLATSRVPVLVTARSSDLLVNFRQLAVQLRRIRTGLLLQPMATDGDLLGISVGLRRPEPIPGRGILVTDETRTTAPGGVPVQVLAPENVSR